MRTIAHVTASRFFGGPEHQMIGLARYLSHDFRTVFLSFSEQRLCEDFIGRAKEHGFEARALRNDTPHLVRAANELVEQLRDLDANLVVSHNYKSDLMGLQAARRMQLPIVAWSHGWTRESLKVRAFEMLDRQCLRFMDRVACVSEGQAARVRRAGVPPDRTLVIRDAICAERFATRDPAYDDLLRGFFTERPGRIVGAAGRLSPEKGFPDLIDAAAIVIERVPSVRFILFGEGKLRGELERRIAAKGLRESFILAGFRTDMDRFLPFLDLFVLPSYTEGLPNVVLESFSAGVPVVATAVGGTPEVVEDRVNGCLVPPRSPSLLADAICHVLTDEERRRGMGWKGKRRVLEEFSFAGQVAACRQLFTELIAPGGRDRRASTVPDVAAAGSKP